MIKEIQPVSLTKVAAIVKKEGKKEMADFITKFVKINSKDAEKLKEELNKLEILKLKPEHVVKIIDFLPIDAEDLRKIFAGSELSLEQNEITKIIEITKKYKK